MDIIIFFISNDLVSFKEDLDMNESDLKVGSFHYGCCAEERWVFLFFFFWVLSSIFLFGCMDYVCYLPYFPFFGYVLIPVLRWVSH